MRKQFEHNYRHMSDVMRLAFLENNDISIDDCANVDFNSLSTASILQRNIQQQLQQERRNQLNNHHHQQQQQQQRLHHHQSFQNHPHNRQQEFEHDLVDESYDNVEDYEMSDSRIFATATPNSSTNRINLTSSTPKSSHQQASGSGGAQRAGIKNGNSAGSKRRAKEATPRVEFSNQVQVETIQNYGDGFLCDEPGCGKSFPSLRKLRHHKVVHSDDFPFVCEFKGCAKKFKRKFGIDLHSTTHFDLDPGMYSKTSNNSSLPFFGRRMQYSMCKPCGQKFKTVHEYQYHMLKHGKEPFKCPVKGCGQTFGIWKSFQKHRASHYFNYYCKMDPRCDHHTSNLQLLKLHIYCCHFRRKLPENATLASRDPPDDETEREDHVEVICPEDQSTETSEKHENQSGEDEDSISMTDSQPKSEVSTPRRDSRLRKNPPRSSTFGHQDYASINNGISFTKSMSSPGLKKSRSAISTDNQSASSQPSIPIERKIKLPLKVLPKRSAQRLPMSLIADDGSTEDEGHSSDGDSFQNEGEEQDLEPDPARGSNYDRAGNESYDHVEDFETSDSRIFSSSTPNSSTNRINLTSSTPKSSHQQASGSGGAQRAGIKNGNSAGSKRRAKEATPRVEFSNQVQVETIQNYGDGFLCDEPGCGKSFPSLRKLRHHKVVHSDDFPFVCEFKGCAKKFKRKFGIDLHSTTHFDLDPGMYSKTSNNSSLPFFGRRMQYSMCKPCGQKFKTVHEYQYHMLKHGKEPFKCPVKGCGQTFGIWKSFQKHRASHYFNYYCKMDPRCDHHTSNLQLLKLHIYCCHFRRKLPENATLASRDPPDDETEREDHVEVICPEDQSTETSEKHENQSGEDEDSISMTDSQPKSEVSTPRRDSRLRKNPPRSSTFGHQDYASINNGISFTKSMSSPGLKKSRSAISTDNQSASSQPSIPIERKIKLPLKVLPKRSAQRLPMSLIADDGSTEDEGHSSDGDSFQNEGEEQDLEPDPTKRNKFKCHLCDYKFSVRFQLTKHLSTHLELTPEMYSATADKQVVQLSERRRREFYCDKCSVKFEHMPDLDVHMRKHGQRPYVCNFCQVPSTFRLAKQYLSHLYEHRFNYKCTMAQGCDFTINRKDALKLHIFRMHLNQQLPSYIENFANMIDCNEWPEQ